MKSRNDRKVEIAAKIDRLAEEYFKVLRSMQDYLVAMNKTRELTGDYPEGSKVRMTQFHAQAQRLTIRILRQRANMLEVALASPFEDVSPDSLPDFLPEGW